MLAVQTGVDSLCLQKNKKKVNISSFQATQLCLYGRKPLSTGQVGVAEFP